MKVSVLAPKVVREALSGPISAWDPRKKGPIQYITLSREGFAGLYGEDPGLEKQLECRWELDRDPRNARKFWKVTVGPVEVVEALKKRLSYHFDDPLDVR